MPKTKFDQTVELHVKLGVDSKHADQQVRGTVVLPNGTGKTQKVLVFAKGPKAEEAEKAASKLIAEKTKKGYVETAEETAREMKVEAKKYTLSYDVKLNID